MEKNCVQCNRKFVVSFDSAIYCGPRCFSQRSEVSHVGKINEYAHYVYVWLNYSDGGQNEELTYIGRGDGYAPWRHGHGVLGKRVTVYSHTMRVIIVGEYDKDDAKAVVRGLVRHYRNSKCLINSVIKEANTDNSEESTKHQLMILRAINQLEEIFRGR